MTARLRAAAAANPIFHNAFSIAAPFELFRRLSSGGKPANAARTPSENGPSIAPIAYW